ncbi:MAG TPA: GNAT family N-acetyltransferase [Pyrinomonadaceae bacterium]|jgi:ribosomal protein S18 acetylase RimI-like enzyme|nr:GNAT family N-acetyltransferase [Pyrinomonadaceae bacterium]
MAEVKENSSFTCKFLNESYFQELLKTFLEAFSDYPVPFQHTEEQFRRHLLGNAVDLNLSVGCFTGQKMVAFSLNGFGPWNGRPTAYDSGTGTIPEFRRRGAGRAMFEFMMPILQGRGVEQILLEVITDNEKAVNLYRALDFEETRKLLVLKAEQPLKFERELPEGVEVREIVRPDWDLMQGFWDGEPSWQNSPAAIERTREVKKIVGAFIADKCIGYLIFSGDSGKIAQLAVAKENRNRGTGTLLLSELQKNTNEKNSLQVINLDESLTGAVRFFQNRGFTESLNQYEMIKFLT